MPNRVIRDSILTSRQVGQLDWFQQALLVRLILSCDDYGRYFAAPDIIRNRFFCIYPGGATGRSGGFTRRLCASSWAWAWLVPY